MEFSLWLRHIKKTYKKIQGDFPNTKINDFPAYDWIDTVVHAGIHHRVIGVEELSELTQYPVIKNIESTEDQKYGFKSIEDFPYPWGYEMRFTNKKLKSGLKILFIRDSFSRQMMPFIREVFAESVFIFDAWRYQFNKPIIDAVKPDIVVYLVLETHLESMLKDYDD